jgi:acetyl esterase/lipase
MPKNLSKTRPVEGEEFRLWEGNAPLAAGSEELDIPTLTIYPPTVSPSGAAMILCAGGGYDMLAWEKEAINPARWLAGLGIFCAALKYRLAPQYAYPAATLDAARAIRALRYYAADWKFEPKKIGILGFSAGGHLAAVASTRFDTGNLTASDSIERVSSRPDLAVLLYSVINLTEYPHNRSRKNLLGDNPSRAQLEEISADLQVTPQTPPAFLFHTVEDGAVSVEHSIVYARALRRNGVPFELHCFERGQHGVGLAAADPVLSQWPKLCHSWLRIHGFTVS